MTILRMKEAGENAVLAIASATIEQGQYGEQVKFVTATGDILYAPSSSVQRQLDRIGVAEVEDIAGTIIFVERAPNHSKPGAAPYWNFSRATEGDVVKTNGHAPKMTAAPPKVVPSDNGGYDRLVEQYAQCMDSVTEVMKQRSVVFSDSAYVAAVATLFIQRERAGV